MKSFGPRSIAAANNKWRKQMKKIGPAAATEQTGAKLENRKTSDPVTPKVKMV
jgi:hypothetical protein